MCIDIYPNDNRETGGQDEYDTVWLGLCSVGGKVFRHNSCFKNGFTQSNSVHNSCFENGFTQSNSVQSLSQSWLFTLQTQYSQSWLFTHCGCPVHSECEVGQGEVE